MSPVLLEFDVANEVRCSRWGRWRKYVLVLPDESDLQLFSVSRQRWIVFTHQLC